MTFDATSRSLNQEQAIALPDRLPRLNFAVSLGDAFCFLVPAALLLQFQGVGLLFLSDLVLVAALPLAILRHRDRLSYKPVRIALILGSCWLVSQIVTDLLRGSPPEDFLRGWTKIFFMLANFTVVWLVACVSRRRFLLYGAGLATGAMLDVFVHPTEEILVSPWKFGYAIPFTLLVAVLLAQSLKYRKLLIPVVFGSLALIHAYENFRILSVVCLISAVYSLFLLKMQQRPGGLPRLAGLALAMLCGIAGFTIVYEHYAEQGVFGVYAQQKLEAQSGKGGLLLGGRSEILASSQAIIDSPFLGHGSWARDQYYVDLLMERHAELGYKDFQGGKRDDLIPTHSFLFGSWVESGLAGAIFWIFILSFAVRSLFTATGAEPLLPLLAFCGLMLSWDILFSPLGTPTRFVAPYFIAAIVLLKSFGEGSQITGWKS